MAATATSEAPPPPAAPPVAVRWRAARASAAALLVALIGCAFVPAAWGGVPAVWTDVAQVQLWSGWQIAGNVARGDAPLAPTSLAWVDGLSLTALIGNPGAAWVQALASLALPPAEARLAAVCALFVTNVAAFTALGAAGGGTRGAWLGAVVGGTLAPATWELAHGAWSAGWVAPGVASVFLSRVGWRRSALVAGALGAACAPVPAAAAALAGLAWTRPSVALVTTLVLSLLVAAVFPPFAESASMAVHAGRWVPFGAGAGVALPLLAWVALALVGRALPGLAGAMAVCVLVATGPVVLASTGAPLRVGGMEVALPWSVARPGEWLVAAAVLGSVTLLARPWTGGQASGLALLALVDVGAQAWRGAEVLPGQGHVPVVVPAPLSAAVGRGAVLALPLDDSREGLVGWVPFAGVPVVGGPGLHRAGAPARRAVETCLLSAPSTRPLAALGAQMDDDAPSPRFALRDAGVGAVIVLTDGGVVEAAVQRRLGTGVRAGTGVLWTLAAPQQGAFAPLRGGR